MPVPSQKVSCSCIIASTVVIFLVFHFIIAIIPLQESEIISIGLWENIDGQWKDHAFFQSPVVSISGGVQ